MIKNVKTKIEAEIYNYYQLMVEMFKNLKK